MANLYKAWRNKTFRYYVRFSRLVYFGVAGLQRSMRLVRIDLCYRFAMMKGVSSIFDRKKGEFDLSLDHACYHFSLEYHRALSDFQVGCTHHETIKVWRWELKTLGIIEQKIINFDFWRILTTVMGMQLQTFIITVIRHTSMSLGHLCYHSSWNDLLYYQRKNVPGSQLLGDRFATSENRMLQVRADFFSIWVLLLPSLYGTHMQILSQ